MKMLQRGSREGPVSAGSRSPELDAFAGASAVALLQRVVESGDPSVETASEVGYLVALVST